jgi:hypothetical protein
MRDASTIYLIQFLKLVLRERMTLLVLVPLVRSPPGLPIFASPQNKQGAGGEGLKTFGGKG